LLCDLAQKADRVRTRLECALARSSAVTANRRWLLEQPSALFVLSVELLRDGPPLTRTAYESLRAYLAAGRGDREHVTPAGDRWRNRPGGAIEITPS